MKYFLYHSPTSFQNTLFTFSILNLCLEWKLQGDHLRWDTYRLKQLQNFKQSLNNFFSLKMFIDILARKHKKYFWSQPQKFCGTASISFGIAAQIA